ncbi:MAG: uroporphyrinogen-III synthase [Chitinophagaceae bacterium]|nr:uroporphyrinogen-III synthase [Chitinophagaceae bacterium]
MKQYKILSTKKISPALLDDAKKKGFDIIEKEFIQSEFLNIEERISKTIPYLDREAYVVFTSANAVEALVLFPREYARTAKWKIFCLSGKTLQEVAIKFVETQVMATAKNAADLADEIIKRNINEVIFFCGNRRRDDLPDKLKNAGIVIREEVLYLTNENPERVTTPFDGILFYSPSGVESFFSVNQLYGNTRCFAIGKTTERALHEAGIENVILSDEPEVETVVNSAIHYFNLKRNIE